MAEFNFMLQIIADIDENTKEVTVKKVIPINTSVNNETFLTRTLSDTEAKYGILTFGKEAKNIGMTVGTIITIMIDGKVFREGITTHKSVVGRIDGMTAAYAAKLLNNGDKVDVRYDVTERILKIDHAR